MTDRLNPEAFLAAKDAAQEAFQANKDWHDVTTAMLSAYDKSLADAQPRTITTVEGLEALPVGTVLRVARKELAEIGKSFGSKTLRATEWTEYLSDWGAEETEYLLPATVLHVPTEGGGE